MTPAAKVSPDQGMLTVSVPLAIRRHGGRKQVVSPAGASDWAPRQAQIDSTLVKALARAFRWRKLLEDGFYATVSELASAEKINSSYVSRVLCLTVLAPEIVEAILDGRQPRGLTVALLFRPFPVDWEEQARVPGLG